MKVLGFNGSPRAKKGITDRILQQFLKGAAEAGAETETVYLAKKKIKFCTGCFSCWLVHPGRCIHKNDDMDELRQMMRRSDMLVYASPVYIDGITAIMKNFMERCMPNAQPFVEIRDGHTRHPLRGKGTRQLKMVVLSTCGFGERDNFDPLLRHMEAAAKNMKVDYLGALIRPMGPFLDVVAQKDPEKVRSIDDAFHQAGFDAVAKGEIGDAVRKAAEAPLMSRDEFIVTLNSIAQSEIEKYSAKKPDR
ncbi:MAG: flavodoxin family protein [Deltaproteobacteria bacterium]|nr:flavodoxin family protein [Deltaproteobacteria bacterium]